MVVNKALHYTQSVQCVFLPDGVSTWGLRLYCRLQRTVSGHGGVTRWWPRFSLLRCCQATPVVAVHWWLSSEGCYTGLIFWRKLSFKYMSFLLNIIRQRCISNALNSSMIQVQGSECLYMVVIENYKSIQPNLYYIALSLSCAHTHTHKPLSLQPNSLTSPPPPPPNHHIPMTDHQWKPQQPQTDGKYTRTAFSAFDRFRVSESSRSKQKCFRKVLNCEMERTAVSFSL